jgi:hypothetical protein
MLERLAMVRFWLKTPLADWLASQAAEGFRVTEKGDLDCCGHAGARVLARGGSPLARLLGAGIARTDVAWLCPRQERLYHVRWWQRRAAPTHWPDGLQVHCCRQVSMAGGRP